MLGDWSTPTLPVEEPAVAEVGVLEGVGEALALPGWAKAATMKARDASTPTMANALFDFFEICMVLQARRPCAGEGANV